MKQITFQSQTLDNDCVSACLAMVLSMTADVVRKEFHNGYHNHKLSPTAYLISKGCKAFTPSVEVAGQIKPGYIYLLCVPALNANGQFHCVVLDARDAANPKVFDPANTSRRRYVFPGTLQDPVKEFELLSWVAHTIIEHSPALED